MRAAPLLGALVAALALAGAAVAATTAQPTRERGVLTVGLVLPSEGFRVGAVRGRDVVLAKGFEVELARVLARRLGLRAVRFVDAVSEDRVLAPGRKPWDVALAQLAPTRERARAVDFSHVYLASDQAVLVRRGLERPRSLSALRRLLLCAERGTRAVGVIAARIAPQARPLLAPDSEGLLRLVQTGRCDAGVAEAATLGLALEGRRDLFGGVAGVVETERAVAAALERRSPLTPAVDRALDRLRADGTIARLARAWLRIDLARLPALR